MSVFLNKSLSITLALAAIVTFSGLTTTPAFAEPATTNVSVNVEVQQKGAVNWDKGAESDVTAMGIGLPPENAGVRGTPLARRAAIVDAYRNLAETIQGVQVDSETVLQDLAVQSDTVRAKVSALVKGARILEEGTNADGSYFVKMSVPLYGVSNSVAAVAVPELDMPAVPEPLPEVGNTDLTKSEVSEIQSAAYTGVIINAAGLGLEATFSPVIYDVNGRGIYGMRNINPDLAISKGMVEYATNLEKAVSNSRAGANPLVLNAVAVKGGKNSVNKVNVVVSVEDGDKILLANEKSGMLQNCAVVFVK